MTRIAKPASARRASYGRSRISALRETVVDEYDDATVESKQLDYTWEDSDYALFPVWMLSTSWNGKGYLFA